MSSYIRLKDGNNYLYPEMYGVDTSNVLYSNGESGASKSYTSVQDCYASWVCNPSGNPTYLKIDNVTIFEFYNSNYKQEGCTYFVKKGQTVSLQSALSVYNTLKIYGLKYHS